MRNGKGNSFLMREQNNMKILFLSDYYPRVIQKDADIISNSFPTRVRMFYNKKPSSYYKLLLDIIWADYSITWFETRYSALCVILSKILGKKCIVAAAYGMTDTKYMYKTFSKIAINNADIVLANSQFKAHTLVRDFKPKNVIVIYHGVDRHLFRRISKCTKENLVVMIATVSKKYIQYKRIDLFIEAARQLPEYKFMLIGKILDDDVFHSYGKIPSNLTITNWISDEDIKDILDRCKVYVQISNSETFGVANAEAMLMECIPVVSNVGALPEVVGNAGIITEYGNIDSVVEGIKKAITMPAEFGKESRKRIVENFTYEMREKEIVKLIISLYH